MLNYGFYKELEKTFAETANIVLEKLKEHDFSIVSQIDLKQKFKDKLGIDYRQYTILGLCDPESAYKVLQSEKNIGLLLPCNMIVYEKDNKTAIAVIKPSTMIASFNNLELEEEIYEIELRLNEFFNSIE